MSLVMFLSVDPRMYQPMHTGSGGVRKEKATLIREVSLGLMNTPLNLVANEQYISYLLSVNVLSSVLSSGPTSCL